MVDDILVNLNLLHLSPARRRRSSRRSRTPGSSRRRSTRTCAAGASAIRSPGRPPAASPAASGSSTRSTGLAATSSETSSSPTRPARRATSAAGIDRHGGAVGRWLVTRDGFDFLFFYLYETDAAQHRAGDVMGAVEGADDGLGLLVEAAGGLDRFLDRYAVIVVADHSQSPVAQAADAAAPLEGLRLFRSSRRSDPDDCEWRSTASNRAAMVYLLPGARTPAGRGRRADARAARPPTSSPCTRRRAGSCAGGDGELRFRRGGPARPTRAATRLDVEGDADLLDPPLLPERARADRRGAHLPRRGRRDRLGGARLGVRRLRAASTTSAAAATARCGPRTRSCRWSRRASSEALRRPGAVDHRHGAAGPRATSACPACAPGGARAGGRRIASPDGGRPRRGRRGRAAEDTRRAFNLAAASPTTGCSCCATASSGRPATSSTWSCSCSPTGACRTRSPSALAFVCAATSNFVWNRLWTFRVSHGAPHHQYARFLAVSAPRSCLDLVVLRVLVEAGGHGEAERPRRSRSCRDAGQLPWQQALDVSVARRGRWPRRRWSCPPLAAQAAAASDPPPGDHLAQAEPQASCRSWRRTRGPLGGDYDAAAHSWVVLLEPTGAHNVLAAFTDRRRATASVAPRGVSSRARGRRG